MSKLININVLNSAFPPESSENTLYQNICDQLKLDIAEVCKAAGSGHLGGSLSSVDLFATLYLGGHLRFSLDDPRHPFRDRVLVRGHLGPLRYPLFSLFGWVQEEELKKYRRLGSRMHGHESMRYLPGVDITPSGSLGMLLSYGVGSSIVAKNKAHEFKTYVFLGDGEEQEGNVSEAARHAANIGLNNLVCILDQNGKQLSRPTSDFNHKSDIAKIWEGYGWNVITVENGHDSTEIDQAYRAANSYHDAPTLIIAKTIKGYGLPGAEENFCGYHTISSCSGDVVDSFIDKQKAKLESRNITRTQLASEIQKSTTDIPLRLRAKLSLVADFPTVSPIDALDMNFDQAITHYYHELKSQLRNANNPDLYFLTADLMPTNMMKHCGIDDYKNFYDVGLREQHMMAMAHGISVTDPEARVHIHGGDAFSFRSLDQLNSAGQGESRMIILGDRAGLAHARNGSTHQTISQPFALNWQPNLVLLEPSDVEDYFACLNYTMKKNDKLYYLRVHSLAPQVLPKKGFSDKKLSPYYIVGDDVTNPDITIVTSGITTSYAWEALKTLTDKSINARLVNITAPSLIDTGLLELIEPDKPCLCIYNGHPEFLPSIISRQFMKFNRPPLPSSIQGHGFEEGTTGTTTELVEHFGFDSKSILEKVQAVLQDDVRRVIPAPKISSLKLEI